MRIAQIQMPVGTRKKENLDYLESALAKLAESGCIMTPDKQTAGGPGQAGTPVDLVTVGEMFICPYVTGLFPQYAEPEGGETCSLLSSLAKKYGILLSAGSVPEVGENGSIYNTAYVFDRSGRMIAKHRKMHMFDIAIRGGQHYRESDTLTAGDRVTTFDTEFGRMGLCICFDCRFPELVRLMVLEGARVILVPAAFNMTTGPAHWELMFRSRAVDDQCFMVGTSVARDPAGLYVSWGHSLVVSPWGNVISEMDERPGVKITELDLKLVDEIREQLPLLSARREDVYRVVRR